MHSKVLRALSNHISDNASNSCSKQQALATTLLLVYYEVVLGGSARSARCHIQGAKALLDQMSLQSATGFTAEVQFFAKIFHYFDVMIALSLGQAPIGGAYCGQLTSETVDEIFGFTTTLWPLMYRLANVLTAREEEEEEATTDTRDSIDSIALAKELSEWRTNQVDEQSSADDDLNVVEETTSQIANAYRFSALLVLYTDIFPLSSPDVLQLVYRQALDSLLRTAALDGPTSTLVWPLFTVGRLAQSSSDRTILRHMFSRVYNRHRMKIVEMASSRMRLQWNSGDGLVHSSSAPVFFG